MLQYTRKNNNRVAPTKILVACTLMLCLLSLTVESKHIDYLLQQESEKKPDIQEYDTELEMYFDYLNAFLMGFRSKETIPSALNCTKYLEGSIYNMNETQNNWDDPELAENVTTKEKVFNYTSWISYDLAPSSRYCFMSGL